MNMHVAQDRDGERERSERRERDRGKDKVPEVLQLWG